MAHIAIDARIINSSTGRYVERLLTYLQNIDSPHRFSVLVRAKDKDFWQPSKENFKVVVADYHQYTFGEQIGFYFFLKRLKVDLVHFCMPQQPLLYKGTKITTVHDLNLLRISENEGMSPQILKFKQRIFAHLLRSVTKNSTAILTPTQYTKDDLLEFQPVDPNKVIVTYEAADRVSNSEEPVTDFVDKKFMIVVGRAEKYKNQLGAVEAHQLLIEEHPDLWLVIIGKRDQTSDELEAFVREKGYKQIVFFGFASDPQLAWFYSHCVAYTFPSFMEGFGLPALEAMRHGAPVVSSNATCLPEVLGDAALYFNPADSEEMAREIHSVLTDQNLRNELISRGSVQVDKYSWQRMAEETLAVYDKSLGGGK